MQEAGGSSSLLYGAKPVPCPNQPSQSPGTATRGSECHHGFSPGKSPLLLLSFTFTRYGVCGQLRARARLSVHAETQRFFLAILTWSLPHLPHTASDLSREVPEECNVSRRRSVDLNPGVGTGALEEVLL